MLVKLYRVTLIPALRFRWLTIFAAVACFGAALAALRFLGGEFLPDFRESNFVIFISDHWRNGLIDNFDTVRFASSVRRDRSQNEVVCGLIGNRLTRLLRAMARHANDSSRAALINGSRSRILTFLHNQREKT